MVDSINRPMMIYCDSKVVEFFSGNNKSSGAAKHIDIKYLFVRLRIQDQTIKIEHISTTQMLADPLTKGLPPSMFKEHANGMGLVDSL